MKKFSYSVLSKFSPLICQNKNFFDKLKQFSRSRRKVKEVLQQATDAELLCLVECCLNILKGRLPLTNRQLSIMKKQSQILRKLARSRSASTARTLLLKGVGQKGDGLPLVPAILASVVLPLITETIVSNFKR